MEGIGHGGHLRASLIFSTQKKVRQSSSEKFTLPRLGTNQGFKDFDQHFVVFPEMWQTTPWPPKPFVQLLSAEVGRKIQKTNVHHKTQHPQVKISITLGKILEKQKRRFSMVFGCGRFQPTEKKTADSEMSRFLGEKKGQLSTREGGGFSRHLDRSEVQPLGMDGEPPRPCKWLICPWLKRGTLPKLKLTYELKMVVSNRNLLFQGSIFRGELFQGGYPIEPRKKPGLTFY